MNKFIITGLMFLLMVTSVFAATWEPNVSYTLGDIVEYDGKSYEVLQSHNSQVGWNPVIVPSLFKEVTDIGNSWAGQSLVVGDVVEYNGKKYRVLQSHTTQDDWTPEKVPALFIKDVKHDTYVTVDKNEYTLTVESVKPVFQDVVKTSLGYRYNFVYVKPEFSSDSVTLYKRNKNYVITHSEIYSCINEGYTSAQCYDGLVLGNIQIPGYQGDSIKEKVNTFHNGIYTSGLKEQNNTDSEFMKYE